VKITHIFAITEHEGPLHFAAVIAVWMMLLVLHLYHLLDDPAYPHEGLVGAGWQDDRAHCMWAG
jgi:hypothetical protein